MRKLLGWLLVTLGIAALVRRLRRRAESSHPSASTISAGDPADELRRKLAESRSEAAAPEHAPQTTVAERRAEVHDEARATLEAMRARTEQ
jgi:hypothetical protein